jgi:hypothetical protein
VFWYPAELVESATRASSRISTSLRSLGESAQQRRETGRDFLLGPERHFPRLDRSGGLAEPHEPAAYFIGVGVAQHYAAAEPLLPGIIDPRVEDACIDPPPAEQHDCLALDQSRQVVPVNPRDRTQFGMACLTIRAVIGAVIRDRLRDVALPGGLLDPLPRAARILLAHRDRQVGVAEQ